ncbi:hypothetical protein HYH03_014539 [Edaphochlamys debaryana]|uniref:Uncharacterized protein n=1 Tax=Edaphochlamys debaryana TaxID=47281 RepID=A0A835XMZ1_9CHLO|nr:hypothetical protein HYH03_014539 [Edaphochlamys debaryana]|eukprot:KAG2486856.1 hypothetical protein HYH03_014539 [Edaphochlamys debaryana]
MLGVACQDLRPAWPEAQWPELCAVARRCCAAEPTQRPGFRELERELVEMEAAIRERQRLPAPPGKPPEAAPGKGRAATAYGKEVAAVALAAAMAGLAAAGLESGRERLW